MPLPDCRPQRSVCFGYTTSVYNPSCIDVVALHTSPKSCSIDIHPRLPAACRLLYSPDHNPSLQGSCTVRTFNALSIREPLTFAAVLISSPYHRTNILQREAYTILSVVSIWCVRGYYANGSETFSFVLVRSISLEHLSARSFHPIARSVCFGRCSLLCPLSTRLKIRVTVP
jgi:hypothetical protein